jgi:hypothetical protein
MPGIDPAGGAFAVPAWAAGAVAALFVVVALMAFSRAGQSWALSTVGRYAVVLFGALVIVAVLDRTSLHERAAERRALEARAAELTARAIAPGSALACLDAGAGNAVESSCEKAVFANPAAVAAAVSYVDARLRLLADGLAYAEANDRAYESSLAGLRRAMASDRFGIVAHVLKTRDGCNRYKCVAFAQIGEAARIKAHLKDGTFEKLVARHAIAWLTPNQKPLVAPPPVVAAPAHKAPVASAVPDLNFPSASSIPPVSIMNAEPAKEAPSVSTASPMPGRAPAAAEKKPPAPQRHSTRRTQTTASPAKPAPSAPITLTPSTAFDTSATKGTQQ